MIQLPRHDEAQRPHSGRLAGEPQLPGLFGKFELAEQIAHGGMATVHRAFHTGPGGFRREVVIKRILPELAAYQPFQRMFVEEAKLSALLDHTNLVQVYDFGIIDGVYFLAMEYIDGVTLLDLRKYLRRWARPFPVDAAAFIVHKVCQGLAYAHGVTVAGRPLGLVHRDISPSNIMVSAHGEVKLLDFGIAKAVEAIGEGQSRSGTMKGKWSYMSPEQAMGRSLSCRSDLFSAGVVLWEILAGKRLFKDKTAYLTLHNVVLQEVPPLSSLRPDVPPPLAAICQRALERDPERRYPDADAMGDDLEAFLETRSCSSAALAALVAPLLLSPGDRAVGSTAPVADPRPRADPPPLPSRSTGTLSTVAGEREEAAAQRRGVLVTVLASAAVIAASLMIILSLTDPWDLAAVTSRTSATFGSAPLPVVEDAARADSGVDAADASRETIQAPAARRMITPPVTRSVIRRSRRHRPRRLPNVKAGELADPYGD